MAIACRPARSARSLSAATAWPRGYYDDEEATAAANFTEQSAGNPATWALVDEDGSPVHRRPQEGRDHHRRTQHLSAGGGKRALPPSIGGDVRRGRRRRSEQKGEIPVAVYRACAGRQRNRGNHPAITAASIWLPTRRRAASNSLTRCQSKSAKIRKRDLVDAQALKAGSLDRFRKR